MSSSFRGLRLPGKFQDWLGWLRALRGKKRLTT
jgi:hypothetical protein